MIDPNAHNIDSAHELAEIVAYDVTGQWGDPHYRTGGYVRLATGQDGGIDLQVWSAPDDRSCRVTLDRAGIDELIAALQAVRDNAKEVKR